MSRTFQKKIGSSKKREMSIAIISIYRNNKENTRQQHKDKFLKQISVLKKYGNFDVYLIEQSSDNCKFNIGKLKNIGFQKAIQSKKKYDFFIFTDADIIPDKKLAPYYFKVRKGISLLATRGTRYQQSECFFGSCLGFDKKSYQQINGYPNNFWGWGGEDEAILIRANLNNINIYVPKKGSIIDLETNNQGQKMKLNDKLKNLKNKNEKDNNKSEKEILETKIWRSNGLSNLDYQEISSSCSQEYGYNLNHYLVDLNYSQDHLKHTNWFDVSSFERMSYSQLKKTRKQTLKKYKKCHPKYY